MEKNTAWIALVIAVAFALIGGLVGINMGEAQVVTVTEEVDKVVEIETIVEVPTIVNNTVEVIVETFSTGIVINKAVEDFMDEVEDKDRLLRCGFHEYDFDEISTSKVYDEFSISGDDEDLEVEFEIKLKYDEDDERSCKRSFDVKVFYEEDEDPVVTIR